MPANRAPKYEEVLEASEVPSVPPATYKAIFLGVERHQTQYGEKYRWHWQLPEARDFELTQVTGMTTTGGSNCAQNVKALLGRSLVVRPKESIPWSTLTGVAAALKLEINPESGWNVVVAVTQLPQSAGGPPIGGFPPAAGPVGQAAFQQRFAAQAGAAEQSAFTSTAPAKRREIAPDQLPPVPAAAPSDLDDLAF